MNNTTFENCWPKKYDLFGVQVSATTYTETVTSIFGAIQQHEAAIISCQAVHAVISASRDPSLLSKVNSFQIVAPDGQPVRWALNFLYQTQLTDRVYGPELMLRICRRAAQDDVSIYLYGSMSKVIEALKVNLKHRFPRLYIAGAESPPFRSLSTMERKAVVRRINQSGAEVVFVGLGCPKQDLFAYWLRDQIQAVQICVGAAFDFHAATKAMAPPWMQRNGLEWLFRMSQEPGRLWRRYLVTNTFFLQKLLLQSLQSTVRRNDTM